jgi:uncharacterized membrane protein YfcA
MTLFKESGLITCNYPCSQQLLVIPLELIVFFGVLSFGASFVNGALGYGYSSLSIPLAILVYANRIVNPAYVLVEATLNTIMGVLSGRGHFHFALSKSWPIIAGLAPGVLLGSLVLSSIAPVWVRLTVYAILLPLILLQLAGVRRPINRERAIGVPLGVGVGTLYSLTTISGPPIALFFNNQGLKREDFRAAISQIRIAESYLTTISYYFLGLFTASSFSIFTVIAPPVVFGLPIGILVIRRISLETFRRVTMAFDSLIVNYGLRATVMSLYASLELAIDALVLAVVGTVIYLLYRFLTAGREPNTAEHHKVEGHSPLRLISFKASEKMSSSRLTQEFSRTTASLGVARSCGNSPSEA